MPEYKRIEPPFEFYVDQLNTFNIEIDLINRNLQNALQMLRPDKKKELNSTTTSIKQNNPLKPIKNTTGISSQPDKYNFSVESSKAFFIVNPTLSGDVSSNLPVPTKTRDENTGGTGNSSNSLINLAGTLTSVKSDIRLEIKCMSKTCQEIEGDITLRNLDRLNDIRVYRVSVRIKPKQINATLEFVCPVGMEISQKIPIYNSSDRDWSIKAELTDNCKFFSGPQNKIIPKRMTDFYLLKFSPSDKKKNCTGKLLLTNTNTQEIYRYDLIGKIEEPLAEGEVVIECKARETKKTFIELNNNADVDFTYNVETDLAEVISGLTTFQLKRNSTYRYEIIAKPLLGQTYFGQITFKDQYGGNKWWTVKVDAKRVINSQVIEMKTEIRKIIYFDFTLENPTNENIYFRCDYDGEYLFGNKELRIEANGVGIYQLYFSPLKVGNNEGSLHIYSETVGEFLYKLKLFCTPCPPIYPEVLKAELGKSFDYIIHLENPIGEDLEVFYSNTNVVNFTIVPDKIYIGGYSQKEVTIRYTPSSLEHEEDSVIVFDTVKIGKWEYYFKGKGLPPTNMETTVVSTYVGGITSGIINFKNPFKDALTVTIDLNDIQHEDTFKLMIKKEKKFIIESFRILQIPFTFAPKKLTKYLAHIKIMLTKSLFWTFPIEGITEVKSKGIDFVFKTKSKKMFETKINLDLTSLPDLDLEKQNFSFSLRTKEEKFKFLVEKCFTVSDLDVIKGFEKGNMFTKLTINIKFYPLRPFKTECELVITKSTGGQWIYNIILESTEPDPDDIIHIQSSLDKVAHVSFKLHNIFTKNAKFAAYFSHESSAEFSVSPKDGVLDQSGR